MYKVADIQSMRKARGMTQEQVEILAGMSPQYITESFVKIRNLCGREFFNPYKSIPWDSVFGMRNFLSHEYGDVDTEGIFNTVKTNIPELLQVTEVIQQDVINGKHAICFGSPDGNT